MHVSTSRFPSQFTRVLPVVLVAAALAGLTGASSAAAEGSFVIGNGNAVIGSTVTFWGAQWWKLNTLSGGSAPASFKGWADNTGAAPACGETWSTRPGNSSQPPAGPLPPAIEVIVTGNVTKSGPTISGDTQEVALVETGPGYEPDPGHPGTGTVLAVSCSGFGGGPLG